MSTTVTYKGDTITTVNNETRTLLTQDKWVEDNITITDNSQGGVENEIDPVFSASPAAGITQSDIVNWNSKSNFSGNYNDLTNKPTIPAAQVSSDWTATSGVTQILHKPTLADVATSGDYNDLINKPNIPTSISDLNDDSSFITTETDPVFSASPAAEITANDITSWNNKSDFSGSYNDLTDKPTITGQVNSDWNANSGVAKILNKPSFAGVAISGDYNDLSNTPVLDTALSTVSTRAVQNQAVSIALEDKASKQYVDTAISNIPSPMVFKGSLGTSGTITTLPSADAINTGFTYKVIQAGTYASQTAEIGDIFISDGTTWILVPSGDDIANVVVTPVQSSGTKIAVVTVNNTSTDLYAPTPVAPPNASTLAPNMDGTAAAGTSTSYARADHIHPVDTSRASANDVSNLTTRVGSLETAIGTGGSVENKITAAIQGLDSSIVATSNEAISAITITDGKITTSSKITIPTYSVATTAANGLMSAADKAKINTLSTVDNNTTYANATTASDGLMSSTDKLKLSTLKYIKDGNNISVLLGNTAQNVASGDYSIAEGNQTTAAGLYSHAEGEATLADDWRAHAEGLQTTAAGEAAHSEGINTLASTRAAHVEGKQTMASGEAAHAEGINTFAEGNYSHAEGNGSYADGIGSHAEGEGSYAEWDYAHAEGSNTTAGSYAHAEGIQTSASASPSHAEGIATTATGQGSHTEGYCTGADGDYSHSEGYYTSASFKSQHVFGECNIVDPSTVQWNQRGTYIEIVGNGTTATRSNARTLDWNGNEVLAGKLTVGANPVNNMDVVTKQYMENAISTISGGGSSLSYVADGSSQSVLLGKINDNEASGAFSIAEGAYTKARGTRSHAECDSTLASGVASHAEGDASTASGDGAHAEGSQTYASGNNSHTEGSETRTSAGAAHAEGYNTNASSVYAHAEGSATTASGNSAHAEGYQTHANESYAHAEGYASKVIGAGAHSEGYASTAQGWYSHAEGMLTLSSGQASHTEGNETRAIGNHAHSEGISTTAAAYYSHAEGSYTLASGGSAHAEGDNTTASGAAAHAEGDNTLASGSGAHTEGSHTTASLGNAHAEGYYTLASGDQGSHTEGYYTTASNYSAHAEGRQTLASEIGAHAEGFATTAAGGYTHTGGIYTLATRQYQTVIGKYNKVTLDNNTTVSTDAAFVIGNGASTAARSDAFAVKWDGTLVFANGAELSPAQVTQLLALLN